MAEKNIGGEFYLIQKKIQMPGGMIPQGGVDVDISI